MTESCGIARFLSPGPNNLNGFILTTGLGIAGAFVATYIGQTIGVPSGLIGATIGTALPSAAPRSIPPDIPCAWAAMGAASKAVTPAVPNFFCIVTPCFASIGQLNVCGSG